MLGVHLTISVHFCDDLRAESNGAPVAGQHRRTDALVVGVLDEDHTRVPQITHEVAGAVGAAVVHDDDLPDEGRDAGDHAGDRLGGAERRDHHGDVRELDRDGPRVRRCRNEEEVRRMRGLERPHGLRVGLACWSGVADGLGATSFASRRCAVASSVCASAVWPS